MIADTSFLFALLAAEDSNHARAVEDSRRVGGQFVVLDRVLEELATTLAYKKGVLFSIDALGQIRSNKSFIIYPLSQNEVDSIFGLMGRIRRSLSFVDYSVLYLAESRNEGILTYDKQMQSVIKQMKKGLV